MKSEKPTSSKEVEEAANTVEPSGIELDRHRYRLKSGRRGSVGGERRWRSRRGSRRKRRRLT